MNLKIKNSTILTFVAVMALSFPVAINTYAGSLLFVAPNRIVMEPDQRTAVVNVTNKDDRHREFKIVVQNYIMTENGTTQIVDTFPYSAERMIRYVPRRIKLAPGERQTVRIMARRPKDLSDGDYHSHLLFDEMAPPPVESLANKDVPPEGKGQLKFKIEALYGLAIPIVIEHGAIENKLVVTAAKIKLQDNGSYIATVSLDRTGNSEGKGFLTIEHTTPEGIAKVVGLGGDLHIYRELEHVNRTFRIKIEKDTPLNGLKAVLRTGSRSSDKVLSTVPVTIAPQDEVSIEN
jgi:hypothetical protein